MDEWDIRFHRDFKAEFRSLPRETKIEFGACIDLLRRFGPALGRPHVDGLKGSAHANMKELRFMTGNDWWRFAFAFDPQQKAVVLCGGGKGGGSQQKFYRQLAEKADRRFAEHLQDLAAGDAHEQDH